MAFHAAIRQSYAYGQYVSSGPLLTGYDRWQGWHSQRWEPVQTGWVQPRYGVFLPEYPVCDILFPVLS